MNKLLKPLLAALCLLALSTPALAHFQARAYAPEDLRELSYDDQVRVIRQEYMEQSGGRRIADDQLRFYVDQVNRSNWRFSDIKRDIAKSLGGSVGPAPGGGAIRCESIDKPQPHVPHAMAGRFAAEPPVVLHAVPGRYQLELKRWPGHRLGWLSRRVRGGRFWRLGGNIVVCESIDRDSRRCPTPWRGPSRLVRQLSGTTCIEGRNWGSENGQVVVWSGCRGEFARGRGDSQTGTIRCESNDNRVANCRTPWRGDSRVVRQLSDTRCREGQNWDSGNGQVTVWSGCRAEFGPTTGGWDGGGEGGGSGYNVTCASQNGGYTTCNWPPGQGQPRLLQQLSHQACVQGRTWGMAGSNRIWVNGGCRGRFGR